MPFYKDLKKPESAEFAERTIENLQRLRQQLKQDVPERTMRKTLNLATWNIRDFDNNKFGYGPRLEESFYYIAEVIARFDMVAIQEINVDLAPLRRVMHLLGPSWEYIVTDVTHSSLGGNGERLGFIFDTRKISFRGIAGEIVLPDSASIRYDKVSKKIPRDAHLKITEDTSLDLGDHGVINLKKGETFQLPREAQLQLPATQKFIPGKQFARTPFLASFQAGWFKFSICTVHLYYGAPSGGKYKRRVKEIDAISKFLAKRFKKSKELYGTGENIIVLGDFNIVDGDDPTMKALTKNGFTLPPKLFKSNLKQTAFYDQIAFMERKDEVRLADGTPNHGVFHFQETLFRNSEEDYQAYKPYLLKKIEEMEPEKRPTTEEEIKKYYLDWRTWQVSDHLPLWVQLEIDFSDDYLANIET